MSHSHGDSSSPPVSAESIQRGYETTDAMAGSILVFLISLVLTLAVVVAITIGLFFIFTRSEDEVNAADFASSPLVQSRPPSPAPPLQPSPMHESLPYEDTNALKVEYDRLAGSYGNELMADHVAHNRIPVEAAMKLLAADNGLSKIENTATAIPSAQGPANSVPTPYGDGGRGSSTGTATGPGVPQK